MGVAGLTGVLWGPGEGAHLEQLVEGLVEPDMLNPEEQNDGDSPRNGVGGREGAGAPASPQGRRGPSFSANLCMILGSSLQGSWVFRNFLTLVEETLSEHLLGDQMALGGRFWHRMLTDEKLRLEEVEAAHGPGREARPGRFLPLAHAFAHAPFYPSAPHSAQTQDEAVLGALMREAGES